MTVPPTSELCSNDVTSVIRHAIQSFLSRCRIPYPPPTVDPDFVEICFEAALERGFPLVGKGSLRPFILECSVMSITAYAHLPDERIRVFITLYTAALVYMDDFFEHDVEVVRNFNHRFLQNQPHGDGVQDAFARMLLTELPTLYNCLVSNLITTSTLDYINSLSLEHDTRGMKLSLEAANYPAFCRNMSGVSQAYALFVFPPELPVHSYIQVLPDIMGFVNYVNDILSLYKEELAGDSVNYISLVAVIRDISKVKAMVDLCDDVVDGHMRCLQILSEDAYDAYLSFSHGYVEFHASHDRYRLKELEL